MTLRQYFSSVVFILLKKNLTFFLNFFHSVQIFSDWPTAVSSEDKFYFICLSSAVIQHKLHRFVLLSRCMNYQKAFSHKVRHKNLCRKVARNHLQIWAISLQALGNC